jgi:HlyD family secretion protein
MKKLLITLILLTAAGGGGYAYWNKYVKVEDKASVTQSPVSVGNIIQQVQASGTLEALRTVQVGSQVSGVVKKLYVDFNSIVHKDELLAELDPSLLQVQVDIQNANIERQNGDIEQQKVQLENDKLNLGRTQTQADKGLVSVQALEAAKLQVKSREAQIVSAQKQLIQTQAALAQAQLNVKYTKIISPIDGVVVNRNVDEGQTVQSSVNVATFFTIATDLTTLKLSAGIDEAEIGYIRPDMPVSFTVDSYGTRQFTGNVDAVRLNATTNNNVVTYPVWITVRNNDLKLRPGMTATVRIVVDRADNVLRVPNQALRFRPTTDIYTWLGMPAPAPGQGRGRGANALNGTPGAPGAAGTPTAEAPAAGGTRTPRTRPGAATPGAGPGQDLQASADALGGGRRQRDPNAPAGQGAGQGGRGGFGQGQPGQDFQANAGGGRRQRDPNAPPRDPNAQRRDNAGHKGASPGTVQRPRDDGLSLHRRLQPPARCRQRLLWDLFGEQFSRPG